MKNKIKYEDLEIKPIRKYAVPIVIVSYKGSIASTAVLVQSIIDNSSKDYFYDIVILHSVIPQEVQKRYESLVLGRENFSLRFFHVLKYAIRYPFFQRMLKEKSAYVATFYRLLIPELFSKYEKVIYLDGDVVVNVNIALMMEFDVSRIMLGAVRDIAGNRFYYTNNDLKKYRDEVLKLKNPDNYFNAGVLIINPKTFLEEFTRAEWWALVDSQKWYSLDQDVLNMVCQERVLLISCTWNYVEMGGVNAKGHILDEDMDDMLAAAPNPNIIHYVGRYKPWNQCTVPYFEQFWKYAVKNSFFEDNFKMIGKDLAEEGMLEKILEGRVGLKSIRKIVMTWLAVRIQSCSGVWYNRTEL
ncbi:MAG: hypothetical protein K2P14_01965 [Anaeroplasmataceae bacterium]|mgnify:CR=1 FL=1|nr:hypothetical protein [Anaeroplasmataceae bacterium]